MPYSRYRTKESYELYVVFGGLSAWVPRTAKTAQAGAVEVGATLVLPRIDDDVPFETPHGRLPSHRPRITRILGTSHGEGSGEKDADHLNQHLLGRLRKRGKKIAGLEIVPGSWDLRRETVSFELPAATEQPYFRTRGLCGVSERCPEDRVGLADSSWVPSMAEVCRGNEGLDGAERIDPSCFSDLSCIHPRVEPWSRSGVAPS